MDSDPPSQAPTLFPQTLTYEDRPPATRSPASPTELARGTTVDRYVVLDRVGEGGMGVVYAAYDPSLDRRVALKFLLAHDSRDGVREKRLLREAQAMARLSHPNVAVAYEVGVFHRHVFLAMEFVDGVDLRQWLADETRSFPEVLEVFRAAGAGLAAAHAAGIVHRDFKPANVLIDRQGRPRVTDFGLSRNAPELEDEESPNGEDEPGVAAASSPSHLSTRLTRTGGVLGTPSYMAPEQRDGGQVDARSDQFSFCVALYEAAYGEHPFAEQPVGSVSSPPSSSSVPRWCRQALLRGLSPSRDERYPSMDALLEALRPPTRGKRQIIVATAIAVALAGAGGFALAFTGRESAAVPHCDLGAQRLAGVWDAPRKRQLEDAFLNSGVPGADVVWKAFAEILDQRAGSWIAMNDEACKATHIDHVQSPAVLDLRMECLDRKRDEMQAVVDVLAGKLDTATVDRAVGAADRIGTVSACADVANLRSVVPLPEDPAVREKVRELRQRLNRSRVLYDTGSFKEGIEYMESLAREATTLGYAPLAAEATHALAFHLTRVRPADVEKVLLDAARLAVEGGDWALEAGILITLVGHYERISRIPEGLIAARMAEMAVERAHGDDALRARLANNTGMIEEGAGNLREGLRRYEQAKAFLERASDVDSSRYAIALFNLAEHLRDMGRTREALRHLEHAQRIQKKILRPDHPDHHYVLTRLGDAFADLGQLERAREAQEAALQFVKNRLGTEYPQMVTISLRLALLSALAGDHRGAQQQLERAASLDRALAADQAGKVNLYTQVAWTELTANRYEEVERALGRVFALSEPLKVPLFTSTALEIRGAMNNRRGRFREALDDCRRALEISAPPADVRSRAVVLIRACTAEALLGLGDAKAAREALISVITPDLDLDVGPQWTSGAKLQLARALWATGDKHGALELANAAHRLLTEAEGDNTRMLGLLKAWLEKHPAPTSGVKAAAN